MRHLKIKFSLLQLLLATAVVGIALALMRAWSTFGAVIGPAMLMISFVAIPSFALFRRYGIASISLKVASTIFVSSVALYLSIGPACWAMASFNTPGTRHPVAYETFSYVYRPTATNAIFSPEPIRSVSMTYLNWWMPKTATFHDWGEGIGWSIPGWSYTIIHY